MKGGEMGVRKKVGEAFSSPPSTSTGALLIERSRRGMGGY